MNAKKIINTVQLLREQMGYSLTKACYEALAIEGESEEGEGTEEKVEILKKMLKSSKAVKKSSK